jgi:hypothetical protein
MGRYLWGGDRSFYVAGLKVRHVPPLEQDMSHLPPRVTSYTVLSTMQGEDRAARISGNKFSTVESQRQQIVDMISSSAATLQRGPLMKRSNSTLLSIGEDHDQGKSFAV